MSQEAILRAIPHRPPFLFLDRIVEQNEQRLVAEKTFVTSEGFYEGHYPGNPITPGVILCESCFQAAAVLLASRSELHEGATPVLSRITDARFKHIVTPEEPLRITVDFIEQRARFGFLKAVVTNAEGKTALQLEFALAMVESP